MIDKNKKDIPLLINKAGGPAYILVGGQVISNVHSISICSPGHCTIHNPSDHHMRSWPQNFRDDYGFMERICEHNVGHIDPDDPAFSTRYHGCDGCCHAPAEVDPQTIEAAIEETKRWVTE